MSFLAELRRRKVFQVAIGYLAVAWLLVQVTATILPAFDLPVWALRFVVLLFALGFPVAVLMALVVYEGSVSVTPGSRLLLMVMADSSAGASAALSCAQTGLPAAANNMAERVRGVSRRSLARAEQVETASMEVDLRTGFRCEQLSSTVFTEAYP